MCATPCEPSRSVGQRAIDHIEYPIKIRKVLLLDTARRIGYVKTTYPQHRRLQRVEALLGNARGKLSTQPEIQLRLVHRDHPARLLDRFVYDRHIQRRQRAEVDHFEIMTFVGGGFSRVQAGLDHWSVRDQSDVGSRSSHPRGM